MWCFFSNILEEIARHWCSVGSTPVGLCAQAWSRKIEPDGALSRSPMNPSKSNVFVFQSRYLYLLTSRPASCAKKSSFAGAAAGAIAGDGLAPNNESTRLPAVVVVVVGVVGVAAVGELNRSMSKLAGATAGDASTGGCDDDDGDEDEAGDDGTSSAPPESMMVVDETDTSPRKCDAGGAVSETR